MHRFSTFRHTASVAGAAVCALTLVMGLAGCGGGVSDSAGSGTAAAKEAPKFEPATSGEVHIYTWSDYYPTDLLKKFTQETGIKTTIDYYDNNQNMLSKLEVSGGAGYDIVVPTDTTVEEMIQKNMLLKFNALDLPNGKYIAKDFRNPYYDKGRAYTAPYLYGLIGFMYDSSLLADGEQAPTSWKDFFTSTAAWDASPAIIDAQDHGVDAALLAVGGKPCTDDPAKLQAASDLLMQFKSRVKNISSDGVYDRMISGENSASMIWNGSGHRASSQRKTLRFVFPEEGTLEFEDNWAIPADAKNVQQAMTFINWMMKPENAVETVKYNNYNAAYDGVADLMPQDLKEDKSINTEGEKFDVVPSEQCPTDVVNKYAQIWEQFKG